MNKKNYYNPLNSQFDEDLENGNASSFKAKAKKIIIILLCLLIFGFSLACGLIIETLQGTEPINIDSMRAKTTQVSEVLTSNGERLYLAPNPVKKEYVNIEDIPANLQNAVVAIEDERFYSHKGVDIKGLLRAVVVNIISDSSPGGSTLNMQVSKNLLTSTDKSIARKIKDIYYAFEMDKELSKEQILELYLNSMGLGRGAEGVQAGAKVYFNKKVQDLTLAECAMLAGITKHPVKYSVYKTAKLDGSETKEDLENKVIFYTNTEDDDFDDNISSTELSVISKMYSWGLIPDDDTYQQLKKGTMVVRKAVLNEDAKNRQLTVLFKMHELGYIDDKQYEEAKVEPININIPETETVVVSYIEELVKKEVVSMLVEQGYSEEEASNLYYSGGLKIYTSIDKEMQSILEEEFKNRENFPNTIIDKNGIPQPQASMVITDYKTGHIKALLGGREIKGSRIFNRATTPRQVGSTIKPLAVYTPAIDKGLQQDFSISDSRSGYIFDKNKKWNPRTTTSGKEDMTLRKALAKSSNTVTVKLAEMLGDTYEECVEVMVDYLDSFGLTTVIDSPAVNVNDLNFSSLTLGGMIKGVSPLEMASAYGVLANKGIYVEPTIVNKIQFSTDSIEITKTPKEHKVVSADVAYIMTDMLNAVVDSDYGTGRRARIDTGMPVSGKTGTTNNEREVWFVGYTPYYVASTFISDDEGTRGVEGGSGVSANLWSKVMSRIHNSLEVKEFEKPSNIDFKTINLSTGEESNVDIENATPGTEIRRQYDKAGYIVEED